MEENSISDTPEAIYRKEIFATPADQLPAILKALMEEILPGQEDSYSCILNKGLTMFNTGFNEEIQYETFRKNYYKALHKTIVLHHKFAEEGLLLEAEGEENVRNLIQFNKVFEIFHYWEQAIRSLWMVKKASHPLYDSSLNTDIGLFRFKPINPDINNCFQNLILYLLANLAELGWRRQGDQCMKRIYTKDKFDTHAWKPVMDIKTFVYSTTQKDVNYQHWYNLTQSAPNAPNAIKYLTNVCDPYFIEVEKDRKLFSFPNGIYESSIFNEETQIYEDRWYPHLKNKKDSPSGHISYDICPKRSACKYFEKPFDNCEDVEDWYNIPTPHFQSIMDYQEFPEEVCRWMYILLCGRLLHEVGDLDEWQVMPFLKGKAKSGKSTILTRVCKQFFHALDVGVISNNIETKFGLSAVEGKMLFIAPEISESFRLEQCDFQTMISGEDTSVAEKFQTAKAVKWTVPGAMAGNQAPGYSDNQGSISRRLIVFEFGNKVKKGDTQLGKKLTDEIPLLLKKGNKAYIQAINDHGKTDIWSILPKYFKDTQNDMAEQTNSLIGFVRSSFVELGPKTTHYCREEDFTTAYNSHSKDNNLDKGSWKRDFYEGVFEDFDIERTQKMKMINPLTKMPNTAIWLRGIKVVPHHEETQQVDTLG